MAFFAEAQSGRLSPREAYGRAALRVASAVGNRAIFDEMIQVGEEVFSGQRTDLSPDDLVTMAEATAAHAIAGTLKLDEQWVASHVNPWAPNAPVARESQPERVVRGLSGSMRLAHRSSGSPASR